MHIDSYKICSYGTTWKNGKESKVETVKHMLTSDECIRGKELIRLLEELEDTWHGDYGHKDCHVEITFKNRKD